MEEVALGAGRVGSRLGQGPGRADRSGSRQQPQEGKRGRVSETLRRLMDKL